MQQKAGKWNDLPLLLRAPLWFVTTPDGANGKWQITAANYVYTNVVALNRRCEVDFGSRYKFYAPETLSQMNALKAAIPSGDVFINADDQQYEGSWQFNREVNNWAATEAASLNTDDGKTAWPPMPPTANGAPRPVAPACPLPAIQVAAGISPKKQSQPQ